MKKKSKSLGVQGEGSKKLLASGFLVGKLPWILATSFCSKPSKEKVLKMSLSPLLPRLALVLQGTITEPKGS